MRALIERALIIFLLLLAVASLGWSQADSNQRPPLPPGGLPQLMLQQAGDAPLAKKAALRKQRRV